MCDLPTIWALVAGYETGIELLGEETPLLLEAKLNQEIAKILEECSEYSDQDGSNPYLGCEALKDRKVHYVGQGIWGLHLFLMPPASEVPEDYAGQVPP